MSPLIGRYCGGFNNAPPSLVESSGPSIYIQFHTDISASFQGFYAEYAIGSIGFRTSSDTGESVQTSGKDHHCHIRRFISRIWNYTSLQFQVRNLLVLMENIMFVVWQRRREK